MISAAWLAYLTHLKTDNAAAGAAIWDQSWSDEAPLTVRQATMHYCRTGAGLAGEILATTGRNRRRMQSIDSAAPFGVDHTATGRVCHSALGEFAFYNAESP